MSNIERETGKTPAEAAMTEEELRRFIEAQSAMVLNDPNHRWLTGERVGHDPKPWELWKHWIESGAAKRFREMYGNSRRRDTR